MQKLNLTQSLQQKLSPQQIQFIKLLQVPTVELQARIQEELESNPLSNKVRKTIFVKTRLLLLTIAIKQMMTLTIQMLAMR